MEQDMMDTYNAFAPSQSEVDSFKEKLANSKAEQKNLFLIIFQVTIYFILYSTPTIYSTLESVKPIYYIWESTQCLLSKTKL